MIQPPGRSADAVIAARHVLQRRSVGPIRLIAVGVPVKLEHMAERVFEPVGAAMAKVAIGPAVGLVA